MPEYILPCPSCEASLVIDNDNAGTDVLCPGCDTHLVLPLAPGPASRIRIKPLVEETDVRRNHPLHRTGTPDALSTEATETGDVPAREKAHLPSSRSRTVEEEIRRLAALTSEPKGFDLHNVDTKGRVAFPCPSCHRPVWIVRSDFGERVTCEGCNTELIAPNAPTGEGARIANPDQHTAPRQKVVLPQRRQVEDLHLGEQSAAGRPKRKGGQLPEARTPTPSPAKNVADRSVTPLGPIEPIPAKGDISLAPTERKVSLPSIKSESGLPSANTGRVPTALPPPKNKNRNLENPLSSKSPENAGLPLIIPPSDADAPTPHIEHSRKFRRLITAACFLLALCILGVGAYILRNRFSPDAQSSSIESADNVDGESVNRAKETVKRFYSAPTVEDRAKEVRHPDMARTRMQEYYAGTPLSPQQVSFSRKWERLDAPNLKGNYISTSIEADFKLVDVILELPSDGEPKLDWEHMVSWSKIKWSEFLLKAPREPYEFRVNIKVDDSFTHSFQDSSRYMCFEIQGEGFTESCHGYCEINSPESTSLLKAIRMARHREHVDGKDGKEFAPCILKLRFPENHSATNQVLIEGFVQDGFLQE